MYNQFDYVVVGSGFAGATAAYLIKHCLRKSVLVVDQFDHVGGQMYDEHTSSGLLYQKYGPHIFHTIEKKVFDFVSKFTEWIPYEHKVLAKVDGQLVNLPINIDTIYRILPVDKANELVSLMSGKCPFDLSISIDQLIKVSPDVANLIYNKIFKNYSMKQWGSHFYDLDPAIFNRVPVRMSRDDRYFTDQWQGIPKDGYSKLFKNMLKGIPVLLNTSIGKNGLKLSTIDTPVGKTMMIGNTTYHGTMIYSGKTNDILDNSKMLPYRSLKFDLEEYPIEYYQSNSVINYPNTFDFTRITEFKHFTKQMNPQTVIAKEYPSEGDGKNYFYYPIPTALDHPIQDTYRDHVNTINTTYNSKKKQLILVGRAGLYTYYNMDQVILKTLEILKNEINPSIDFC